MRVRPKTSNVLVMKHLLLQVAILTILAACSTGQMQGPTVASTPTATSTTPTPAPTLTPTTMAVPTNAPTPTLIALTDDQAEAALLALTDLNPGYTVYPKPAPMIFSGTLKNYFDAVNGLKAYQVGYLLKVPRTSVVSRIFVFPSDESASQYLKDYPSLFQEQPSPLPLKALADESMAVSFTIGSGSQQTFSYVVLMRRHNLVAEMLEHWFSGPGVMSDFEQYATAAEKHLRSIAP